MTEVSAGRMGVDAQPIIREGDNAGGIKMAPVVLVIEDEADILTYLMTDESIRPPDGYIDKPVDRDELIERVHGLTAGRKVSSNG